MSEGKNTIAPITIVKKVKKVTAAGHHGGAWKVAYADFVTAMMAFFLLMWLINATTETQRKGIADYFKTTIPINRISGGGDGALRGDSANAQGDLAHSKTGGATNDESQLAGEASGDAAGEADASEQREFEQIEQQLRALSGESMKLDRLMRHVATRLTDEGLVVELFDLEGAPLFESDSPLPEPTLHELVRLVGEVFALARNDVGVSGFVRSYPITLIDNPVWSLSAARAQTVRSLLGNSALPSGRVQRVTGYADRRPANPDPMATRNNRIEIVLLRRYR
jgi:chemotaxis protein MotB